MCRYVIARAWRRSLSLSLAEYCSNVDAIQQSLNFSNGRSIIQPIGKLATPVDTLLTHAHTSRRITAKLTTNTKIAVTVPPRSYLNSNSQMDRRGLVLDSKQEIFYTITFA